MNLTQGTLTLDVETFPELAYMYGSHYEPVIVKEIASTKILSIAYCFGDGPILFKAIWDFPSYHPKKSDLTINDRDLIKFIAEEILPKADIICGHNSDSFDIRTIQERMHYYKLPPPKTFKTKDTLKLYRKYFKNPSNKLGDIAEKYGEQGKISHEGKMTYVKAGLGDKTQQTILRKYNKRDTEVTRERLKDVLEWENRIKPVWIGRNCPHCKGTRTTKRGVRITCHGTFQNYQCQDCAKYFQGSQVIQQI